MNKTISEQDFLNDNGLHYHYDICWVYETFYISDGDNMVEIQFKDLPPLIKALTDFGREYEEFTKNDEEEKSNPFKEL